MNDSVLPEEKQYDAFISYASEDQDDFVEPLARLLTDLGVKVWFASFSLTIGDSLSQAIDRGLVESRYGIVVLSPYFIKKPWPVYELGGLINRALDNKEKSLLPIWLNVSKQEMLDFSPPLANIYAIDAGKKELVEITLELVKVIRPDIFDNLIRWNLWRKKIANGKVGMIKTSELHPGPIRHKNLPLPLVNRLKIIYFNIRDYLGLSFEDFMQCFQRDMHPENEIKIWEDIVANFLEIVEGKNFSESEKKDLFNRLLRKSLELTSNNN